LRWTPRGKTLFSLFDIKSYFKIKAKSESIEISKPFFTMEIKILQSLYRMIEFELNNRKIDELS
jgi:hypothetical protein